MGWRPYQENWFVGGGHSATLKLGGYFDELYPTEVGVQSEMETSHTYNVGDEIKSIKL